MDFCMRGTIAIMAMAALLPAAAAADTEHPRLLSPATAAADSSPGFAKSLAAVRARVDAHFADMPDVPLPKDPGGGYTHEQHKRNAIAIHDAGMLWQLTSVRQYADHAKQLLLEYARMYPGLGPHPARKNQNPGRLFWQSLNESVWLVYAIQGYDAIWATLGDDERQRIENRLLRRMADFLSVESPQTFDRLHNHGTWAVAAVGMTGYVLGDDDYVQRALHGLDRDGRAGFLRQMQVLFSPDGYYSEGPYYQRYALMPYVLFARAIERNNPELRIFEYRDRVLLKAIYACIELSYAGLFFPINDAIKDKGLDTVELRNGLAVAYTLTRDSSLLSIAARQSSFVLTADGLAMARAIDRGLAEPFVFRSRVFRDGSDGDEGALAVLRDGSHPGHQALVLKATSQGMGHGHFDRLHWIYYDNGREIISDYGAARFLNVPQKSGGRYLPENASWAKQTIAHNTLVVDQRSHFDGELELAQHHHPSLSFFDSGGAAEVVAATTANAYDGLEYSRTLMLLRGLVSERPIILDLMNIKSRGRHQYDLPLHYNGQFIAANKALRSGSRLRPLGGGNGYQHLWLRARARVDSGGLFSFTWLNNGRFYTHTSLALDDTEVLFAELGAGDPQFNLRPQSAMILRAKRSGDHSYISVLEAHGEYNGAEEYTLDSEGSITELQRLQQGSADIIRIATGDGREVLVGLSYDPRPEQTHAVTVDGRTLQWRGYYKVFYDPQTKGDQG